ncbi:CsbD family protein [Brevundimonas vesicularis]|uniref:CsbD family protein n=1 Tax=Brevundimonas vesicularis TaxID=41276 RepID=UPI0038D4F2D3
MTDQRIEGAANTVAGSVKEGFGDLTGDTKLQADGKLQQAKGKVLDAYGRVIDGLDGLADKAPADLRDPAKKGLEFARNKPLLTTGILAGAAVLLGGLGRRR